MERKTFIRCLCSEDLYLDELANHIQVCSQRSLKSAYLKCVKSNKPLVRWFSTAVNDFLINCNYRHILNHEHLFCDNLEIVTDESLSGLSVFDYLRLLKLEATFKYTGTMFDYVKF